MTDTPGDRYDVADLDAFARAILEAVGVDPDMARAMSERMIDGDLLGHRTHGLWFLSTYLERITGGHIKGAGSYDVSHDAPAAFTWQANRLPGAWVMEKAIDEVLTRVESEPVVTAAIADCSHIGALQPYLLPFTDRGLLVHMWVTNPGVRSMAPPGGLEPVITTNPLAMGIPTSTQPILIDQATTVASNALFASYAERDEELPGEWLVDGKGRPTRDPHALTADPPGTIMPLGGADFGYKGFALALMVEVLSLAIPGYGRRTHPNKFGQGVFLQVIDPARFSGREDFFAEIDFLVAELRASRVPEGAPPTRLPGDKALRNRTEQLEQGVIINPDTETRLAPWTSRFGIPFPTAKTA